MALSCRFVTYTVLRTCKNFKTKIRKETFRQMIFAFEIFENEAEKPFL